MNIGNNLISVIKADKYPQYYGKELERLKILLAYNTYQFESKAKGLEEIVKLDQKLIPDEIIKAMNFVKN